MDALIAEAASRGQVGLELVSVDSTIVRAHQESAGLAVAGETLDTLEQALAEEKGAALDDQPPVWQVVVRRRPHLGPTTRSRRRVRIVPPRDDAAKSVLPLPGSAGPEEVEQQGPRWVDARGMPLAFVLTPGQAADCRQFIPALDKIRVPGPVARPRTRPGAVAADKAYSSKANRSYLRRRRITAVIPEKVAQQASRKKKGSAGGRPDGFDPDRYKQRNTVERCFQQD